MNRVLFFGIAMFFAVVGIALLGGDSTQALAGHGCGGCSGASACDGGCGGCAADSCCGRRKLFGGLRGRRCHGCSGDCSGSCSGSACSGGCSGCGGEVAPAAPPAPAAPAAPPMPAGTTKLDRAPFGFRTVSFRR